MGDFEDEQSMTLSAVRAGVDQHELRGEFGSVLRNGEKQAVATFQETLAVPKGIPEQEADPVAAVQRAGLEFGELLAETRPGLRRDLGDALGEDPLQNGCRERDALRFDK